jgi:putative heme iron utilization protein
LEFKVKLCSNACIVVDRHRIAIREMAMKESPTDFGLFVTPARDLIRGIGVASLATLEAGTGNPYASMITVATETDGSPLFLISKLALHTRNIEADPRASMLFTMTGDSPDPLALGRVSAMGVAERVEGGLARTRFLARHPEAEVYIDFADFALWRLRVEKAHYVGGFGKIRTIEGSAIIRQGDAIRAWDAEISSVLSNFNAHNKASIARLAGKPGDWQLAACDPDGCDLVSDGEAIRVAFPEPVEDLNVITEFLLRLSRKELTSE